MGGVAVDGGHGEIDVWGNEHDRQVVDEFSPVGEFQGRLSETPAGRFSVINSVAVLIR